MHLTHYSVNIPPLRYGGSERIAWWLAIEQAKMKNLLKEYFAAEDVQIGIVGVVDRKSVLKQNIPKSLLIFDVSECVKRIRAPLKDWLYMAEFAYTFDAILNKSGRTIVIVHSHILQRNSWVVLTLLRFFKRYKQNIKVLPIVTLHYDPPLLRSCTSLLLETVASFSGLKFVAISRNQYERLKRMLRYSLVAYIHNGIPVEEYPFRRDKEEFYLYLGALTPSKGPHIAVKLARKLNLRLVIIGPIRDEHYFNTKIRPYLNGDINYLGEVEEEIKRELLARAKALIFPVLREEYFGLVTIEALACGTPVLAFHRGALPELVVHGKTGFLAVSISELAKYIKEVERINPVDCRLQALKFSSSKMALKYLVLYRNALVNSGCLG